MASTIFRPTRIVNYALSKTMLIILSIKPIPAPFPDIARHVNDTLWCTAFGKNADRSGMINFAIIKIGSFQVWFYVAPGIFAVILPRASGCSLPFSFSGQSPLCPTTISCRLVPTDVYQWSRRILQLLLPFVWLFKLIKFAIDPELLIFITFFFYEALVLSNRDGIFTNAKWR